MATTNNDFKMNEVIVDDFSRRLNSIEISQNDMIKRHYEFERELSNLKLDLKYIRENMDGLKSGIQKLLYGVAAVFLTYITGFVVSGGLVTIGGG